METSYSDINLVCGCGAEFIWTAGEQKFMQDLLDKGKIDMVRTPKRCQKCRAKKKREDDERREQSVW